MNTPSPLVVMVRDVSPPRLQDRSPFTADAAAVGVDQDAGAPAHGYTVARQTGMFVGPPTGLKVTGDAIEAEVRARVPVIPTDAGRSDASARGACTPEAATVPIPAIPMAPSCSARRRFRVHIAHRPELQATGFLVGDDSADISLVEDPRPGRTIGRNHLVPTK